MKGKRHNLYLIRQWVNMIRSGVRTRLSYIYSLCRTIIALRKVVSLLSQTRRNGPGVDTTRGILRTAKLPIRACASPCLKSQPIETCMHNAAPNLSLIQSLVLDVKCRVLILTMRKLKLQMMASREVHSYHLRMGGLSGCSELSKPLQHNTARRGFIDRDILVRYRYNH